MSGVRMHVDEVETNVSLVRRLLATQLPQWSGLAVEPVRSAGTDNALYRLGSEMVVRLPRRPGAAGQVEKEQTWLPRLAPHLPLAVPVPLAEGTPGEGYPWHWSVYGWLDGETATPNRITDPHQGARELAQFIAALQRIDCTEGPPPGPHNSNRGEPLTNRDAQTRASIAALRRTYDAAALNAAWETALATPTWRGLPVWLHGDLQSGNLLALEGRLSAVIDFGCLGVGDPACDVMAAWLYLDAESRGGFRAALPVDEATWARGRGWALSVALVALPYYEETNAALATIARHAIAEVLADQAGTAPEGRQSRHHIVSWRRPGA